MITLVILFSAVINNVQGQTAAVQNIGPRYVNGFPDQIALEQGQQQFVVIPNPQQNYIVENEDFLQQQIQTVQANPGQTSSSVYPQNQQPAGLVYQPQIQQNLPQQQVIQAPEGNQFVNLQYPQGAQIAQNSHPAPVYQPQALQYFSVAPQAQHIIAPKVHYSHSPFVAPFPQYGALNYPVENPQLVGLEHPVALPSQGLHFKPTVLQQVPVPVNPVVTVKEIVKVPVPVKFHPICTVYPFQRNIPGCVLEKALFPGKYHPDVISSSSQKTQKDNVISTTTRPTATGSTVQKPQANNGAGKKESPKKKTPGKDSFVVLNSDTEEGIPDATTKSSLLFSSEDEELIQELEREMQNGKDQ